MATRGRTTDGEVVFYDDNTGEELLTVGATTKPTVPLTTPSVQDVIDALVALDLVTQSD
jgi:hypothetical protein